MITLVPSSAELDYIIGLNAHEESRLPELLAERRTYGAVAELDAKSLLRERLVMLIGTRRVGVYIASPPPSSSVSELSAASALEVIADDSAWEWEPAVAKPPRFLFAVDMDLQKLHADRIGSSEAEAQAASIPLQADRER